MNRKDGFCQSKSWKLLICSLKGHKTPSQVSLHQFSTGLGKLLLSGHSTLPSQSTHQSPESFLSWFLPSFMLLSLTSLLPTSLLCSHVCTSEIFRAQQSIYFHFLLVCSFYRKPMETEGSACQVSIQAVLPTQGLAVCDMIR
jgi:hypothetical protein